MKLQGSINSDKEIWREKEDDYYSPSIFVTEGGGIGINVGGRVSVKSVRSWHDLATRYQQAMMKQEEKHLCLRCDKELDFTPSEDGGFCSAQCEDEWTETGGNMDKEKPTTHIGHNLPAGWEDMKADQSFDATIHDEDAYDMEEK